jgi:hypothetical protein
VNSIFASGHIQQDDESNLSTEDIITQLAAMDAIIEFEKERERERENKIGKDTDKIDSKKDGKAKLSDAELLELKEKEDEERYFNDVLRANTEEDAGEVEKPIPRASVVDVTDKSVLTEEEEEEKYFESIVQSVQNRPSGYLDEGGDSHDYTGSGGVGRGIGEEYGIGVISGCNNTKAKQNSVQNNDSSNDSIVKSDTNTSKTVNSDPLNLSKNQNTEIDFTESLTMTAMEKSNAPVTSPNVHSKHRPSTSLSFASPSTPTSSSSPPAPFASLSTPATMPVINPFGKENRSKTDDEENRIQAELLSIEAIENIMNKKRQSAGGTLKDQSSDRIDLSVMSSAMTATKNRQVQNLQLNDRKVVGENGDDNELKNEFSGDEEEATIMTDVATTSHTPPTIPALALTPAPIIPFRGVNGQPVTVYSNGNPSCNLPDHRVSAGCTAVLAVVKGQRLYVANAGKHNVVLFYSLIFCYLQFSYFIFSLLFFPLIVSPLHCILLRPITTSISTITPIAIFISISHQTFCYFKHSLFLLLIDRGLEGCAVQGRGGHPS